MRQTSVIRITGDICFFFSVLSIFKAFQAWRLPMALFAAACFLLGFVIVRCANPALRGILALLPALCFLTAKPGWLLLIPAAAWIYYVAVMVIGNYAMPLDEYRRAFTAMLIVCLFFIAANIANSTIYSGKMISVDSLVYAFVFLFLGVIAMRRMQMGREMNWAWKWRNALSVAGFPVLAVGVSVVLFVVLRYTHWGLTTVLRPLGVFLNWLLHKLFPTGNAPIESMSLQQVMARSAIEFNNKWEAEGEDESIMAGKGENFDRMVIERLASIGGYVILGLLLALVLFLVLRRVYRMKPISREEPEYEETERAESGKRRRRRRKMPVLGNARQLRRVYKTYLEYRHEQGMAVEAADTSAQILEKETEEKEDAARLRELYIAARYGDPGAVTRKQVQEAQACLERIVS
ncbi:MAG: hypothetical protein J5889_03145 [Clostridia bacterium]|nr:hypothetical protein [Clostridia bacterium]